jgi:methylisocitrate lyase
MKKTQKLRNLLKREEILVLPGTYNALTAKIIESIGFEAVYISGSAVASAMAGYPDIGLLSFTEMITNAKYIVDSVDLPVISDANTGYGNAINVIRTIKEYEKIGVAGVHIEDQVMPKKCGHMEGKEVISSDEMIGKIRAAVDARTDENFLIIARTDSRAVLGLNEAVKRGNAYLEAGADMIFPEALTSREELELYSKSVDAPLLANMTEWGRTPLFSADELQEMGYKIALFPVSTLRVSQNAETNFLMELKSTGTQKGFLDKMTPRKDLYNLVSLPIFKALEDKYLPLKKTS